MKEPLTLEQWNRDPERRKRLEELLAAPVFQEALETLREVYAPATPAFMAADSVMPAPNAADTNNLLALRYAHRAGFGGFLNALKNLTRERPGRKATTPPWGGNILPDGTQARSENPAPTGPAAQGSRGARSKK